jgi:hypothetical protein
MQKLAGNYRKTTLRWAAGVLAGSAMFVVGGATSAAAATPATVPDRAPEAVSALVENHWKYCQASVTRHGRTYGHMVVGKRKHGGTWRVKRLGGHIHYSRSTRPAVYRLHGKCAKTLGGLFHHRHHGHHGHHHGHHMHHHHHAMPVRHIHHHHTQVRVVPRGSAGTGAGGSMHLNTALLTGGAALGLSGLALMVIPGRRRTTDLG